jgi:outer membrane protein, multidrug efflux system
MRRLFLASTALMLTACDLAPEYSLPTISMPSVFKEDTAEAVADVAPATDGKWKRFDETAKIEEFAWWRMFNDEKLDALMEQAMKDNPSLTVAIERVNAARAVADTAFAPLLPSVEVGFGPERQLQSAASINANLPPNAQAITKPYTLYTARGTISYDLDLFGQNRGRARAATNDADAEQNNYLAARLSLQAEVAQAYYRLAALRAEDAIVKQTIATRQQNVALTKLKNDAGLVDSLVLSQAETDLATAKAEGASVAQSLAVAEHALAALLGVVPSQLNVTTAELKAAPPRIPAGIPSALLERRPDIKQAEKLIAAANERIGVARGGYFPDISISATGGSVASSLSDVFKWSSRTWAIGPLAGTILTQPIFEGGKRSASPRRSRSRSGGGRSARWACRYGASGPAR